MGVLIEPSVLGDTRIMWDADQAAEVDAARSTFDRLKRNGYYAYKVKKPLDLGFLNFSTLELRRHFCEEELRLNRRLAPDVYQAVMTSGKAHGVAPCGYRAIESLRLEKGYLAWGSDIGPDYTPFEAGLGWAVKLKRDVDFVGRQALTALGSGPLTRRMTTFTVDDPSVVLLVLA